jgi:hypothetical protein
VTFLTESELAERWRVDARTVRRLRAEGRLDFMRPAPRRVVYPIKAVELFERENLHEAHVVTLPRRRKA